MFLSHCRVFDCMTSADSRFGLLLTALVVLSAVAVPAAAVPTDAHAQQAEPTADTENETVDAIYVRDNGSAVLVYNDSDDTDDTDEYAGSDYGDEPETPTDLEYGADIGSNLVYALATQPVDAESDASGYASVWLNESNVSGDGRLSVAQPDSLSTLEFQLAGETTTTNARSNMSLNATFDSEETAGADRVESVSTAGNVTVTGSNYTADGTVDMEYAQAQPDTDPASFSFVLTEDDGNYTIDVERNETLSTYEAEDYSTREQARLTLREQFGTTASEFDGNATVSIERYEFTGESRDNTRLDIAYTVEYTGVEGAVTEMLAENITRSEDIDMDQQRAEELTTQMTNLTVERVAMSYEAGPEAASATFEADIDNYDDVVIAAAEIAEATETEEFDGDGLENLDDYTAQLRAQQAADLTQRTTWSATVSRPSADQASVTAEAAYTTENWDAYVTELSDRGVETYNTTYSASAATTADERVDMTASLTVDGDVFEELSRQALNASEAEDGDQPYVVSFLQADFQRGRVNVSSDEESVRFEMGAHFDNLSALRDALAENETVPAGLTGVVGATDDGTTTTYVDVEGAVGADATESDVRALAYVDDETTVYMPGEWDREFPSMDTERAASFLGVDLADDSANGSTVTPTTGGSGPGFGAGVALLALVGAALLAGRRT